MEQVKHGASLRNEAEVFSLPITNSSGPRILSFDSMVCSLRSNFSAYHVAAISLLKFSQSFTRAFFYSIQLCISLPSPFYT